MEEDSDINHKIEILRDWGRFSAVANANKFHVRRDLEVYAMLGGPKSGKTAIAQRLADYHGWIVISVCLLVPADRGS